MAGVLSSTAETYTSNLRLVMLFSIPFVIAFLIPLLASLPTYVSIGGIFLREASIFINLNFVRLAVIIFAFFFSLLFLSFAFVAISLIVKSRRTHLKISKRVLLDIERYIGRVFLVLLIYAVILYAANILGYLLGMSVLLTAIVGFFGFAVIFYAPSAIVIDDKKAVRAIKDSYRLVVAEPRYFILWFVMMIIAISVLDSIVIAVSGGFSGYVMLALNSLFVLPYFVIFQAEAYMKRFPILRH